MAAIVVVSMLVKNLASVNWLTAIAAIAAVYHTASLVSIGSSPAVWALETYLDSTMRQAEIPGMAVLIVKNDSVVFSKGFGVRELGSCGGNVAVFRRPLRRAAREHRGDAAS